MELWKSTTRTQAGWLAMMDAVLLFFVAAAPATEKPVTLDDGPCAVAVLQPLKAGRIQGTVRFTPGVNGVEVIADVTGLTPGSEHAIHVHQFGDCRAADGASAGGHYNPEGHPHELPPKHPRHAGDLGNLVADERGHARYAMTVQNLTVDDENAVLGRSVIVHAGRDTGEGASGEAGPRIGCGAIGLANPGYSP